MRQTSPKSRAKGWHRGDIRTACHKRGFRLIDVADLYGIKHGTMRGSLAKPTPNANRALAHFLGVSVHELWPDWYDVSGKRIPGANHTKKLFPSLRQKRIGHLASTGKKSGAPAKGEQV